MSCDPLILPPPLEQGDCIGLFMPAGPIRDQETFTAGRECLHRLGFRTRKMDTGTPNHDYLAAEDDCRADEFHAMWADPEIKALMAVRGGFGCLRLMSLLRVEPLRESPKRVIGFSDLTILLNTLVDRAGIISFHGPVLTTVGSCDEKSLNSFNKQLTSPVLEDISLENARVLREGTAEGVLRGGNLTTIAHLLGTPWEFPLKDTVLLLEDTSEPMYKIDRILTQLSVSGRLENVAGILLGSFDCKTAEETNEKLKKQVWERILELTAPTDCPVWGDIPAGHLAENHTFPLGMHAIMDSTTLSLRLVEPEEETTWRPDRKCGT